MSHRKPGTRLLRLSLLAALGLMALTATSAQAENLEAGKTKRGTITVLGSEELAIGETVTGEEEGTVLAQVPGRGIEMKCPGGYDIEEAQILKEGVGDAKVTFLECKVFTIGGKEEVPCNVLPKGNITGSALLLAIKHEGKAYVLGEPKPGNTVFTIIEFGGAECPLATKNIVSGSYSGELKEAEGVELLVTGNQAIQKLLGDKVSFGAFEALVIGSGKVHLTGAHKGCKWGVA